MNCAECGERLPEDARFCTACGRRVGVDREQDPRAAPAARARPALVKLLHEYAESPRAPTALVLAGCVLGIAILWSSSRDDHTAAKASAERIAIAAKAARTTSQAVSRGAAQFSPRKAMQGLFGNYDPVVEGAYWTVSGAPKQWSEWNGRTVAIRPLISRSDEGGTRHVLVTNSIDVKDGMVVKQGAGCRNCKSLIGAALFERRGGEWQLAADHRFLSVDGVWGAPPAVSVAFRPGGGVELQITRVHGDQVKQIASVVLIDKDRVVKSAITPASAAEPRLKPRAAARSPSPAVDSPFPSSADGP